MALKIKYWNFFCHCGPKRALTSSSLKFLDHTQRHTPIGRASLDDRSARRGYPLLDHTKPHNRQTSMPPAGFEPTISVGERLQTCALVLAATETGNEKNTRFNVLVTVLQTCSVTESPYQVVIRNLSES